MFLLAAYLLDMHLYRPHVMHAIMNVALAFSLGAFITSLAGTAVLRFRSPRSPKEFPMNLRKKKQAISRIPKVFDSTSPDKRPEAMREKFRKIEAEQKPLTKKVQ
jgi:hypothetical protein